MIAYPYRIVITVLMILVFVASTFAHEEPPKTAEEQADWEKNRTETAELGIHKQILWVHEDGDSTLLLSSTFDTNGNLVEETIFDDADTTTIRYIYDDDYNWLEQLTYSQSGLTDRTAFIYDERGCAKEIRSYDHLGLPTGWLSYDYRLDEGTISLVKRDGLDSVLYHLVYTYEPDSNFKRMTEAAKSAPDGSLIMRTRNVYKNGKRIEKQVFDENNQLAFAFSFTYTPSEDIDRTVRTNYDSTGASSIGFEQSYTYRNDGLPESIVQRDSDDAVIRDLRFTYEFFEQE